MSQTVVIVYLPNQGQFTPRVDEFRRTAEEDGFGKRLVWKGRALTIDEFHAEFPKIIEGSRLKWGTEPLVEIREVEEAQETAPEKPSKSQSETKPKAQPKPAKKPAAPQAHTIAA